MKVNKLSNSAKIIVPKSIVEKLNLAPKRSFGIANLGKDSKYEEG